MKSTIIALGHKNPDSDSVISSILVSRFGKKIFGFEVESRVAGDVNNETKFVLDYLKIQKPKLIKTIKGEQVIMVDTTEPSQIVDGLTEDNLLGIIDHHNLGGLKSSKPIFVRVENIGCTCSVIYKILKEKNIKIDKNSAVLMMACIISDTLNLTSPTTTPDDKKILAELSQIAKISAKDFATKLFAAKSSLRGISIARIVECDYKDFEMGGKKVGIGVWETTDTSTVDEKKASIVKFLQEKKMQAGLDFILFGVVDILKNNSYCYIIGEDEKLLVEKVFKTKEENGTALLSGIVSRKKQIVPPLMQYFAK
jgi:manganese-dependent inorganic pyrophosphatase